MATTRAGPQSDFMYDQLSIDATGRGQPRRDFDNIRPLEPAVLCNWIDLLARISHDLRTPLNAVIGFSDIMQNEMFGPLGHSRYQEYARHIKTSGDLLLKAAEDTLAMTSLLASPNSATLDDLRFDRALADAIAAIAPQALEREVAIAQVGLDDATVRGDRRIMPRALRQLLTAALAAALPGSRIALTTTTQNGRIRLAIEVGHEVGHDRRDAAARLQPVHVAFASEPGMGRDEMSIWLARILLEQQGARLTTRVGPDRMTMTAEFEQAVQADFFSRET